PAGLPRSPVPVMLNVGNPDNAFLLGQLPSAGVGLARIEFIVSHIGIHPMALVHPERVTDPAALAELRARTAGLASPGELFIDGLASGVARIAAAFWPRPVIVRFSDFKTNEYGSLLGGQAFEPVEANPMIGFRGASRYYDPRYREAFALECAAIKRVRDTMGLTNVKVMIPFCRTLGEGRAVLAELAANGLRRGEAGLEIYVMCEIPNNVVLAAEFSELFDGFSIGSNDLTQLTLGVDRDSSLLAHLFDEQDPGVKRLIAQVVEVAHQHGRKVGLCGQAPSDHPEFAGFLASIGIDSVSVTPDALPAVVRHLAAQAAPQPPAVIHPARRTSVACNVTDYDATRRAFRWAVATAELVGPRGLNIAEIAVDRHARGALAGKVALRWRGKRGDARDVTYAELAADMRRFGNALRGLGVGPGDVVFALCPRIPALYAAALGTLAVQAVFSPLFSAFGPDPIVTRVRAAAGKVLVTTASLYARKIAPIRHLLPSLRHVIVVDDGGGVPADALGWDAVVATASPTLDIAPTPPDTLALLHFTSGTTGRPKAAMHVHGAVVAHHATARMVLDLHPDDVFWCTADPGWVTGTSYGLIAPLAHGVTSVVDEADFVAERWYQLLERERVTVWYTAPTAIRMLMKAGPELARGHDLSRLRVAASVGEPLNPEAVVWGNEVLGLPFLDNWWQTETGGIMIANLPCMDVRPGSMGKPLPGIDAGIVAVADDRRVTELPAGEVGQLALRPGWPAMFRG
ncbi:MAG TPA: AMP-binding protein, partial [Kofleriaceae bacterium]|nr:AMP-binding protein [Kofleriaceae bacterium]